MGGRPKVYLLERPLNHDCTLENQCLELTAEGFGKYSSFSLRADFFSDCMFIWFGGSVITTPPKTNIESGKGRLEDEIPFGNSHFQVPC